MIVAFFAQTSSNSTFNSTAKSLELEINHSLPLKGADCIYGPFQSPRAQAEMKGWEQGDAPQPVPHKKRVRALATVGGTSRCSSQQGSAPLGNLRCVIQPSSDSVPQYWGNNTTTALHMSFGQIDTY